jgi:hypothetical protein
VLSQQTELAELQRSINRIQKVFSNRTRKKALQLLMDDTSCGRFMGAAFISSFGISEH